MSKTAEEIKVGKKYIIDADFNNGGIVEVVSVGNLYCVVRDNEAGAQWETMCHRLSDIPKWAQELVSAAPPPASEGVITEDQFCKLHSAMHGEEIDRVDQLVFSRMTGRELYEFVKFCVATLPNREPEEKGFMFIKYKDWKGKLVSEVIKADSKDKVREVAKDNGFKLIEIKEVYFK